MEIASVRLRACSFPVTEATWNLAVCTEMSSARAITLLEAPSASRPSTCISRAVSGVSGSKPCSPAGLPSPLLRTSYPAAASRAADLGLEIHAGHGLDYETAADMLAIPEVRELNIGHFLIGEAVFVGLTTAIHRMRAAMDAAA